MRPNRWRCKWAISAFLLGALIAVPVYFGFVERARYYFHTHYYADTKLIHVPGRKLSEWRYGEEPGCTTLVLARGRPHSTVSTSHGWDERICIEIPSQLTVGRADLMELRARAGFRAYAGGAFWRTGDGGIHGQLNVLSVRADSIEAEFVIVVDAYCGPERLLPEYQHRRVAFQGTAVFRRRERPDGQMIAASGDLFPTEPSAGADR